ncbi:MAG TPA: hypothetical protein VF939_21615 [Puia sp.]
MSETKIIRTALDPTPSVVNSGIPDDYEWEKNPIFLQRLAEAEPYIQAFIRQYGTPDKLTEEMK